jgi:hypothetical protein
MQITSIHRKNTLILRIRLIPTTKLIRRQSPLSQHTTPSNKTIRAVYELYTTTPSLPLTVEDNKRPLLLKNTYRIVNGLFLRVNYILVRLFKNSLGQPFIVRSSREKHSNCFTHTFKFPIKSSHCWYIFYKIFNTCHNMVTTKGGILCHQ